MICSVFSSLLRKLIIDFSSFLADNLHCFCYDQCPFDEGPGICEVAAGGKCFASIGIEVDLSGSETTVKSFGCLSKEMTALQVCGLRHNKKLSIFEVTFVK